MERKIKGRGSGKSNARLIKRRFEEVFFQEMFKRA